MGASFIFPLPVMKARVYQRGPSRYLVYLSWQGKKYFRSYYDHRFKLITPELAHRLAESINQDIDAKGKGFDPRQWFACSGFIFQAYADQWLKDHQAGYAPSVRRDVVRMVAAAQAYFDNLDIRAVRSGHLEDYLKQLPDHLSLKTKQNYLITLHKIFSDAYRREDILRIPGFPRLTVPEPETRWITADWQDRIIKAIPARDRPIFLFIRTYGVRPGEARALMWDCVDFETGWITIRRTFSATILQETTKTKRIRSLPIVEAIGPLLRSLRGISGFVFRNAFGRPYGADLSKLWNAARLKAGAPSVTLYQGTRHSFGHQKLSDGHSLDLIRDIFGHASIKTTRRYAAANMEAKKRVIENVTKR